MSATSPLPRKYGLKIIPVIQPEGVMLDGDTMRSRHEGEGVMINSGQFNGTRATDDKGMQNPAIQAVTEWLEQQGTGKRAVNYRYRDWLISRQRYWGAPIPMVYCETHGWNPVPEDQLPVRLPDDVEWKPTGESPLKLHPTWKNTTCPVCGEPAVRETDTMDTFMCSSWYHLRYLSPKYDKGPFEQAEYDYWMPVDTYTGGIEHATMHLLYTRFFHKAMRDAGIVKGPEPMLQLRNQGIILGEDGEKMSKSRGNVVPPDELVAQLRLGRAARLPDVLLSLAGGRPVEQHRHRGHRPLAAPHLDACHHRAGAGRSAAASDDDLRDAAPQAASDRAAHRPRLRGLRVQHHHLVADGAAQRDVPGARGRRGRHARVERGRWSTT